MENVNIKNVARKPFSVLYSCDINRPTGDRKDEKVETGKGSAHVKPTFIYCDEQNENGGLKENQRIGKPTKEQTISVYCDDEQSGNSVSHLGQQANECGDISFQSIRHDDNTNVSLIDFETVEEKKPDIVLHDHQNENSSSDNGANDFGCGNWKKPKFTLYDEQDENAVICIEEEMVDKSKSSIMCVSMHSATISSMQVGSSATLTEHEIRRDMVLSCRDYKDDIFSYLLDMEKKFRPKSHYMRKQPQVNQEMRAILIDWLVDVTSEYDLQQETLHLAVGYTDRFLSTMAVRKEHLQLVGIASMMIAAKYEEIYPPDVQEFLYITDDTYSKSELLQMEHIILKTLDFNLSAPTAFIFLLSYLNEMQVGQRCQYLAKYLCDLSLIEYAFLIYPPSLIAVSCSYLAHYMTDRVSMVPTGMGANHKIADIHSCSDALLKVYKNMSDFPQQALREKYKVDRYCRVSLLEPPDSLPSVTNM